MLENRLVALSLVNGGAPDVLDDLFQRDKVLTWNGHRTPKLLSMRWCDIQLYYQERLLAQDQGFWEVLEALRLAKLRVVAVAEAFKDLIGEQERLVCVHTVVLIMTDRMPQCHRWIELKT